MPDLVSHAASAFVFRNFFNKLDICKRPFFFMLLFGVFLPDFVSRGSMLIASRFFLVSQFFHTPLGCILQTILISCLFVKKQRFLVFVAITCGWILHQVFDAFQSTVGPGYYYFFWPLYDEALSLDLFLASYWVYVATITILIAIVTHNRTISWVKMALGRGKQIELEKLD